MKNTINMSLITILKTAVQELGAPELKIKPDIVKREKEFNEQDPTRRAWMLDHTYLCTGNLAQLKQEDNYPISHREKKAVYYYSDYKRHKKVRVRIKGALIEAQEKLKEALFLRGCNAPEYFTKLTPKMVRLSQRQFQQL